MILSDKECTRLYKAVGWEEPGNFTDDGSPSYAAEVREVVNAPTVESGMDVIRWWGWESNEALRADVERLRALAGVGSGTIQDRLRRSGLPVASEAADYIDRLESGGVE